MIRRVSAPFPELAPPPQWDQFEQLARGALELLAAGSSDDCVALQAQVAGPAISEIEYTGAGFFVTLDVAADAPLLSRDGIIGDLHASAPEASPLGFVLFVENGAARTLEVFGYGDWPADLSPFACHYVRWIPNDHGSATAETAVQRDVASMWG